MANGRFFREVELPEQKQIGDGVLFPAVLSPATNTNITFFKEAIKAEKPWLESLLRKSGVILFRGFPVSSASDFNDVVEAFGFPEAYYVGGRAPRTKIIGRVYTVNESPPELGIPFHHEMAYIRFFREVELPEQKHFGDGVVFPAVLSPTTNTNITGFKEAVRAEKPRLESLLQKSGVVLFRGFPVSSASDFNDVVEAFGFPEALYVGGRAPRTKVIGRIYTANESPPELRIPFHHEMSYVPDFPSKLFFFCEEEPGSGGETPIVLSHIIYEKMKERHPDFVAKLEEHGLMYIIVTGDDDSPSSIGGRGWKSAYMTDDKNVAEERAAKLETKLEWIENAVKIIKGPVQAIRFNKETQHKIWFNNLAVGNTSPTNGKFNVNDTYVELGNGDIVPDHVIKDCVKIMEEECVAASWKKGDFMLIDNLMALHGRRPLLKPPRRILASLCK